MKEYQSLISENFQFLEVKFSLYLKRRVFIMFRAQLVKLLLLLFFFFFLSLHMTGALRVL